MALLCLSVSVRFINISQPFIDAWSWRQTDDAMAARNLYNHGFNVFYPQIDWAGPLPGYVGTEFQLVTLVAALLYHLFGIREWVGRSTSVVFFAASVPFFYLLVKKVFNRTSAFCSIVFYGSAPLSIFASRSFMPDMASLCFSIAGLYFFSELLEHPGNLKLFLGTALAISLAILVKLPAVIVSLPLAYMAWEQHGQRSLHNRQLLLLAVLCMFFPLVWYGHSYLTSISYPPYIFYGEGGLRIERVDTYIGILRRFATSGVTPAVFIAMLAGAILPNDAKFGRVFHWWLLGIVCFVLFAGFGNRHPWYQLPAVPVAAALAGAACDFFSRKLTKTALLLPGLVFFSGFLYLSATYVRPLYRPWAAPLLSAGRAVARIAPANSLVIVADYGDSTALYYSGHKGWHFLPNVGSLPLNSREAISKLERLRRDGARYLVFTRYSFWWLSYYQQFSTHLQTYPRIRKTGEYVIFDLERHPDSEMRLGEYQ